MADTDHFLSDISGNGTYRNGHAVDWQAALFPLHQKGRPLPDPTRVGRLADDALNLLFPEFAARPCPDVATFRLRATRLQADLAELLLPLQHRLPNPANALAEALLVQLPGLQALLLQDAKAIAAGDPAASGTEEVIITYPGFYAIAIYRLAHALTQLSVPLLPRMLSELAHRRTGIDIHPNARIGSHFCIDHGTGIVIGQTADIGHHVKLYQGVTLGALSVDKALAGTKRHPTLEDHVVIYAGATILGGHVTIGTHSVIGGNVWLTESVPPHSKVYHRGQIRISSPETTHDTIEYYI